MTSKKKISAREKKAKAFINKAMDNWDSNDPHDSEQKIRISNIIHDHRLDLHPLFDETIFIHKLSMIWTRTHPAGYESKQDMLREWEVFRPDVLFPEKNAIIELDGDWHFKTKKGVKQTNKRNEWYEYVGLDLTWYYTPDFDKMDDDSIIVDLVRI